MKTHAIVLSFLTLAAAAAVACSGGGSGSKTPKPTSTPPIPGPVETLGEWVRINRNVDFVGECSKAQAGVDVGKVCVTEAGKRGTRRAYYLGPTFSESTALAILEQAQDSSWTVLSVTNKNLSAGAIPGIAWPLGVGDQVVVIGLGDNDCLRVREQPTQQGAQMICISDGTTAIIQEGPVDAETFRWWRIAGDGFNGWSVETWLRLPEAIAQALTPATPTP